MKKILVGSLLLGLLTTVGVWADEKENEKEKAETEAITKCHADFMAAWNKHDAKAVAAFWSPKGDLIDPWGVRAKGTAEIEKFFAGQFAGAMKTSVYSGKIVDIIFPKAEIAVVNVEAEVSGMVGADGKDIPAFKHHVTWFAYKRGEHWVAIAARPVAYPPMPAAPAK